MDVYGRFPAQSFELLNGGASGSEPNNLVLKSRLPPARSLMK